MVFFNEYTLKKFGLEGDCGICSCTKCSKSCTDCDWIAMHGPINCHDGGIRYCPYMPKPFEKPKGLFDSAEACAIEARVDAENAFLAHAV